MTKRTQAAALPKHYFPVPFQSTKSTYNWYVCGPLLVLSCMWIPVGHTGSVTVVLSSTGMSVASSVLNAISWGR